MNGYNYSGPLRNIKFKMIFALFPILVGLGVHLVEASKSIENEESLSYRLPQTIYPEVYYLDMLTNLADLDSNFTFRGKVCIQVKVKNATDKIILHSKKLKIKEPEVSVMLNSCVRSNGQDLATCIQCKDSNNVKIVNHSYHEDYEFYIIHLSQPLVQGSKYSIYIPFEGELAQDLAGFYRSSYMDKSTGVVKWLATTQFESTDARKAFPCFDEPIFKAKFQVNIGHSSTRTSISNMPKYATSPVQGLDGWVWDQYEMTVPMSTYLLAFVVSDFVYIESPPAANKVLFRVWARPSAKQQLDFASTAGPRVLEYFENYFNVKYPLPKQDMIAIPDFSSGAMENWGLITYRESSFLYDPKVSSKSNLVLIASTIAHELAHQWFGNLVTMKWWTDLWLNEGFATYVSGLGVNYLFPEWNALNDDVCNNMASVFSLDSLNSSHPISIPIGHPREIPEIFDVISYKKGSSVIRMMNLFLGEETFRQGVSSYLQLYSYDNAEQDDLWSSLSLAAYKNSALAKNFSLKDIMDSWTIQTGYPLITVIRNYEDGTATVSQERYLARRVYDKKQDNTTWWVPLSYTYESEADFVTTRPKVWLPKGEKQIVIADLPKDDWLIMNIQMGGIYRVNYDEQNWKKLINTLYTEHTKIDVLNRVLLIEDVASLARTDYVDYEIMFNLFGYIKSDSEYLPWRAVLQNMAYLNTMLRFSLAYDHFTNYMEDLLTQSYKHFSMTEIDDKPQNLEAIKHKTLIMSSACKYGVGDCRTKAIEVFREWMKQEDPDKINPINTNFRTTVYCVAVKYGTEKEWNFLWNRLLKSNVAGDIVSMLGGLGCTREIWLLNRYLEWSLTKIRRQNAHTVFAAVAREDIGYFIAKSFIKRRIADIHEAFKGKPSRLGNYVSSLISQISDQSELDDLTDFINKNEQYFSKAQKTVMQSLERAKINIAWKTKYYEQIATILKRSQ